MSNTFKKGKRLPTLAGRPDSKLKLSVITSSNDKIKIADLLAVLWALRVFAIDFYPRGCDVQAALNKTRLGLESKSLLERFSNDESDDFVRSVAKYVDSEKERSVNITRQS